MPSTDEEGSSPVEFVLVGALLTVITLSILQMGVIVYVRNIAHDAAVDGAFYAALADTPPGAGAARARETLARTVGVEFVSDAWEVPAESGGSASISVTMSVTFPVIGLLGIPGGWEVSGHAPVETLL